MVAVFDIFVAYKFIKMLSTPWVKTDAYKLGIIDDNCNNLKKRKDLKTGKEKKAFTSVHLLVWNLKKLLDKLPPTKTRLGSFATALWLLKEETNSDSVLLEDAFGRYTDTIIVESTESISDIEPGDYMVRSNYINESYPFVSPKDTITINSGEPVGVILGVPLYECTHRSTGKKVVITNDSILKI